MVVSHRNCKPLGICRRCVQDPDYLSVVQEKTLTRAPVAFEKLDRFCEPGSLGMMCDILWSDPAKNWKPGGPPYQVNPTRGCSFIYGCASLRMFDVDTESDLGRYEAVKMFLDRNNLKLMIRAHEAQALGYVHATNRRLIVEVG